MFTYIEKEQLDQEISALFFFTDGETDWSQMPDEEPYDYKVVWLDYGWQGEELYPWGTWLPVDLG